MTVPTTHRPHPPHPISWFTVLLAVVAALAIVSVGRVILADQAVVLEDGSAARF